MTGYQDRAAAATTPDFAFLRGHAAHAIALVGGAGLSPVAPGTVGALAGIPAGLALALAGPLVAALVIVAAGAVGIWACGTAARHAGVHDHPAIVFDEAWAMAAVVAFVPAGILPVVLGFLAFRLFDIAKPWPIGAIDRNVGSGLGIMLDDAVAALFALASVHAAARIFAF
ncbi:phosphatidylglycerophosphatase A family protein [Phreatobacter sp.]|uniref:phosphatidylglycerophosphatase A family protein n=1 Tax=Phreatobacter sp. TaxID=1966341 RepID=UPI003F711B21